MKQIEEWEVQQFLHRNPTRMPHPHQIESDSPRGYPLGPGMGTTLNPFMRDWWPQFGLQRSFEPNLGD